MFRGRFVSTTRKTARTIHTRSKGRFKTARAAWGDIANATGKSAKRVVGKAHSRTHWRFIVR